ncbi:hypothetical protein Acsp01_87310 [Actinoplanes sp. NBRC 101535]|nr:hypothetical protein Acsp01_87310 [Actinoplanes sp. NBRC 101535]
MTAPTTEPAKTSVSRTDQPFSSSGNPTNTTKLPAPADATAQPGPSSSSVTAQQNSSPPHRAGQPGSSLTSAAGQHDFTPAATPGAHSSTPSGTTGHRGSSAAGSAKRLVPYMTGGVTDDWTDYLLAYQEAGADAIEIGLPFSDPMLDGATIQRASDQALRRGATVTAVLDDLAAVRDRIRVPLIVMTYANLVFHDGAEAFCRRLAAAGVTGLIIPDLPVDEATEVARRAAEAGVRLTLLAAPTTPPGRLTEIVTLSEDFVYAVSLLGTTGERDGLASSAAPLAARIKAITDKPVLIGFGISTPAQAAAAARAGDGVVVASALMRRVLDGAPPIELRTEVAALRAALDQADQEVHAAHAHTEIPGDRR